ncbi:MAG: hypothetical protein ACRCZA_01625 [Shewanella sp.]|uniref:hypothetical protein n=1 Tax=Shewanella sp. TaxID=50422 RepID=UPI003F37B750
MATIPSSNFTSAQVIQEASGGTIRAFSSNDADVRDLAKKPSGMYSSADWAGKSSFADFVPNSAMYWADSYTSLGGIELCLGGRFIIYDLFPSSADEGAWTSVTNGTVLKVRVTCSYSDRDIEVSYRVNNTAQYIPILRPNNASSETVNITFLNNIVFHIDSTWWSGEPDVVITFYINDKPLAIRIKSLE